MKTLVRASRGNFRGRSMLRSLTAEFIGTFALVFAGTGAIVVNQATNGVVSHVGIALAFGLVIAVGVAALAHISGAHFNPAVTISLVLARRFPLQSALPYLAAEGAGAVAASLLLRVLFPLSASLGATLPSGGWPVAFAFEVVMTFLLALTILLITVERNEFRALAPLAIGGVVALNAIFGGPISGASMNPARSLGPAVAAGVWSHHWIYWVAPILGAALASTVELFLIPNPKPHHEET